MSELPQISKKFSQQIFVSKKELSSKASQCDKASSKKQKEETMEIPLSKTLSAGQKSGNP